MLPHWVDLTITFLYAEQQLAKYLKMFHFPYKILQLLITFTMHLSRKVGSTKDNQPGATSRTSMQVS